MAFDVKKHRNKTNVVKFELEGEPLEVEYRKNVVTAPWIDELDAAQRGRGGADAALLKAAELFVKWDITSGDEPLELGSQTDLDEVTNAEFALKAAQAQAEAVNKDKKKSEKAREESAEKLSLATERFRNAKDKVLSPLREMPFHLILKMTQGCIQDAGVKGAEDLKAA